MLQENDEVEVKAVVVWSLGNELFSAGVDTLKISRQLWFFHLLRVRLNFVFAVIAPCVLSFWLLPAEVATMLAVLVGLLWFHSTIALPKPERVMFIPLLFLLKALGCFPGEVYRRQIQEGEKGEPL